MRESELEMAYLDSKVRGARDRQKQALIVEAGKAGMQVVDVVEVAAEQGAGVVGGSLTALFGGRMQVDCVVVLRLSTHGWEHAFAQPFSGLNPLPGEHHGALMGALASPAILRRDLRYGDYPWDPSVGPEVAQYLAAASALRQVQRDIVWDWAIGMGRVELDWAVQLRSIGNGMTHVVMQPGRYGGLTTYEVGFGVWLRLCQALHGCLAQMAVPAQYFPVPASFGEVIDAAGRQPPEPAPASTPGGVEVRIDYVATVREALAPHVGRKVFVGEIPDKKLANIRAHVIPPQFGHSPIVAAIDLTAFGSAKDAIVVTPTHLIVKEFDDLLIIELTAIRAVPEGQKLGASKIEIVVDRLGTMRIPTGVDSVWVLALVTAIANANADVGLVAAHVSAFVGEAPGQLSMEEAQALAEEVQAVMVTDAVADKINAAAQLLLGGQYQASIDAYLAIAQVHPETTGTCYGQIGAGLFFLQQYGRAMEYYEAAKRYGADPATMDENIAEARQYLT